MRFLGKLSLCLLLITGFLFPVLAETVSEKDLKILFEQKQYFDLRDEVNNQKKNKTTEILFYRGVIQNKFNQPKKSVKFLKRFLKRTRNIKLKKKAYELLADNYRKTFQYKKATQVYETLLTDFAGQINSKDKANYENNVRLWGVLKNIPKQTVSIKSDSTLIRNKAGRITVRINKKKVALIFDTGANLSVITKSLVKKLGLQIIDTSIKVGGIAGNKVRAKLAVAKVIKLDNAFVYNAVFLVFADKDLFISEANFQIDGLIGFPVITALKEVTFIGRDKIFIPARSHKGGEQNMCFDGLTPLIAGFYKSKRLTFAFDTGADVTDLYPLFYQDNKKEIETKFKKHTEKIRGVGGGTEVQGFLGENLEMEFAGKNVKFTKIPILTEQTHESSRYFYGNIGQDLIK